MTYFVTGLGIFPAIFLPAAVVVLPVPLDSLALDADAPEQILKAGECSEDNELFRDCGSTLRVSSPSALLQVFSTATEGLGWTAVSPIDKRQGFQDYQSQALLEGGNQTCSSNLAQFSMY